MQFATPFHFFVFFLRNTQKTSVKSLAESTAGEASTQHTAVTITSMGVWVHGHKDNYPLILDSAPRLCAFSCAPTINLLRLSPVCRDASLALSNRFEMRERSRHSLNVCMGFQRSTQIKECDKSTLQLLSASNSFRYLQRRNPIRYAFSA